MTITPVAPSKRMASAWQHAEASSRWYFVPLPFRNVFNGARPSLSQHAASDNLGSRPVRLHDLVEPGDRRVPRAR
jgi:hypothetical protein